MVVSRRRRYYEIIQFDKEIKRVAAFITGSDAENDDDDDDESYDELFTHVAPP